MFNGSLIFVIVLFWDMLLHQFFLRVHVAFLHGDFIDGVVVCFHLSMSRFRYAVLPQLHWQIFDCTAAQKSFFLYNSHMISLRMQQRFDERNCLCKQLEYISKSSIATMW